MSETKLLTMHLLDLQAQLEFQLRSLTRVQTAVSSGRLGDADSMLEQMIERTLTLMEIAADARDEIAHRLPTG